MNIHKLNIDNEEVSGLLDNITPFSIKTENLLRLYIKCDYWSDIPDYLSTSEGFNQIVEKVLKPAQRDNLSGFLGSIIQLAGLGPNEDLNQATQFLVSSVEENRKANNIYKKYF